ncbi:MAG: chromosome segregation protein SMC, partial [Lachnospiraceae bacterium]|nr:chromosome segregation protein SMC [Lachnospiraceae bacterium]
MYLKSIEIQGFKSFANKIKFEFKEGITGIVGPNGSGKSNIADAVRWVFGEQSAKQLRGSSMQDVIFAGTQLRKPLSYAAVAITLDNTDRALNLDYDEVVVERKVYRSGESEYILNGNQCRLRDVYELFYDTGIGKEGYSIIGQGQVDKILSGKPEERRELFDEAAGIVKYKKRKQVALRKLENERANMVRLTDILSELEKQAGPLKRQAETAKKYLALRDELRSYDINAFLLDTESFTKQLGATSVNLENASRELAEKKAASDALRGDYADVDESLAALDEKLEQVRGTIAERFAERSEVEHNIGVFNERIHTEESNISHFGTRLDEIASETQEKERQIEELGKDEEGNSGRLSTLQQTLEDKSGVLHEFDTRILLYRETIEESHGKEIDLLNRQSEVRAKHQEITAYLQQADVRMEEYSERRQDLKARGESLQTEITSSEQAVAQSAEALSGKQAEIDALVKELNEAESELSSAQRSLNDQLQQYQVEKSRLDTLRTMQERYEGFNAAVRKVMEIRKSYPGVLGTVADLLKTDEKHQTAVETALGGNFQNIIVEQESTAKKLIDYLKTNREGRATFLPIDAVRPSEGIREKAVFDEPGVLGTCDEFIQCDDKYRNIAKYLVGRFLCVDNVDHALAIARKYRYSLRIVTLDGEFLNAGGSIAGGAFKSRGSVLNRTKELDGLEKEAETHKKNADLSQKRVNQYRQLRSSLETEIDDLREDLDGLRVDDANLKASLDSKRRELTVLKMELQENATSIENLKKQQVEYKAEQAAVVKALEELEKVSDSSGDTSAETKQLLEDALNERAPLRKEVDALKLELAQLEQTIEFGRNDVQRLKSEIEHSAEDAVRLNEMIANAGEAIESHRSEIAGLEEKLKEMADLSS